LVSDSHFSTFINQSLARKQLTFHALFHIRSYRSDRDKVYAALYVLGKEVEQGIVPVNMVSLASILCMSRNTVSKIMKELINDNRVAKVKSGYRTDQFIWTGPTDTTNQQYALH
jgi:CRP-like cAMP-binding protein